MVLIVKKLEHRILFIRVLFRDELIVIDCAM